MTTSKPPLKAGFLLLPLPGFSLLALGGFVDKLRFSADEEDHSQQRYCRWQLVGLEAGAVNGSSGVPVEVEALTAPEGFAGYDYLVIFGSRTTQSALAMAPAYQALLRQGARRGLTLVAVDNASFLLAQCGLLKGYQVVVHWRHLAEYKNAFPGSRIRERDLYCIDGKRATCAGGCATIDLAVELLARHSGRELALKGLADMLVDESRGSHHALRSLNEAPGQSRLVGRAIALMRQNLAKTLSIEQLSLQLGVSRRQLDRLFVDNLGHSARQHWYKMRMQHCHWRLLNSTYPIGLLGLEIGIHDSSYLSKQFKRYFGITPQLLRSQARQQDYRNEVIGEALLTPDMSGE
ncbi:GlxA family transcriptional regulator [Kistimonas scapharcae]|uniref:GlxA family transcriptional regulator n=1 Tax=Kistimonas scapharcae TaxID=1036133 RepID=A0ABP8V9Q2_9GAMM